MEIFFIRLIIKSLSTGLSPEFLRQIKNSLAEINLYTQACLAESQAEFMFILSVQSTALVAFHIYVDNLIVDAINIVTLSLFLIPQRYFIPTVAVYSYIYIYFFPAPHQPPRYQQQSLTYPRGQVGFVHPGRLDNPELDSLDEHD